MNIISIDLPWNPDKEGRTALAIADLDRNIKVKRANGEDEMLCLIREYMVQKSLILLDIPIEGCEELIKKDEHFRPVDKALLGKISIQPTRYKDEDKNKYLGRGKQLKKNIKTICQGKNVVVHEIYPYAVYKFLAYLKDKELLHHLGQDRFEKLLNDEFRTYPRRNLNLPRKYKREKDWARRQESMEFLYLLLTDSSLGLRFPLHHPNTCRTFSQLDRLCDEYDACLGAIVGIYWAKRKSKYVCLAGNPQEGEILLLADQWLETELKKKKVAAKRAQ